jgi:hypothetical protein
MPARSIEEFRRLVFDDLLPAFANAPSRGWEIEGFSEKNFSELTEADAYDFLRAWRSGLIRHEGDGHYTAPKSNAKEQFFWSDLKNSSPPSLHALDRTDHNLRSAGAPALRFRLAAEFSRRAIKGLGIRRRRIFRGRLEN